MTQPERKSATVFRIPEVRPVYIKARKGIKPRFTPAINALIYPMWQAKGKAPLLRAGELELMCNAVAQSRN
jgi:hypothetical protein